jgi:hypothetical protein
VLLINRNETINFHTTKYRGSLFMKESDTPHKMRQDSYSPGEGTIDLASHREELMVEKKYTFKGTETLSREGRPAKQTPPMRY